jgi:hypothetical protein
VEKQYALCEVETEFLDITGTNLGRVVCLRRLLAGLSLQRAGFDPRPFHVRFVVNKVAGYSHSISVFPCQYHSINASYSSSSTCCSYQKDERAKPDNLQNAMLFRKRGSNIFSFFHDLMDLKKQSFRFNWNRLRSALFWDITRRRVLIVHRRFGTCRSHLHGSRVRKEFGLLTREDGTHAHTIMTGHS